MLNARCDENFKTGPFFRCQSQKSGGSQLLKHRAKIKIPAIWRTGAQTCPMAIAGQAVYKVCQYRIIFVMLSGPAMCLRLYKKDKFQIMAAMAAFDAGQFRFRNFSKKCNNVMDE